jgi:hypothetical protein
MNYERIDPGREQFAHSQAYVPQVVEDLFLFLSGEKIDEQQFDVLKKGTHFFGDGIVIKSHIIGESHVIHMRGDNHILSEVVACVPTCKEYDSLCVAGQLVDLDSCIRQDFSRYTYQFEHTMDTFQALDKETSRIEDLAEKQGIIKAFAPFEAEGYTPKTILAIERVSPKHIRWFSVHQYVEQERSCITRTNIQLKE